MPFVIVFLSYTIRSGKRDEASSSRPPEDENPAKQLRSDDSYTMQIDRLPSSSQPQEDDANAELRAIRFRDGDYVLRLFLFSVYSLRIN